MAFNRRIFKAILVLLGLGLVFELVSYLVAEILWFEELDYLWVFWDKVATQGVVMALTIAIASGFWLGNLALANRLKYPSQENSEKVKANEKLTANFSKFHFFSK